MKKFGYLKTWNDKSWTRKLSDTLAVGMVDENIDVSKQVGRKPWYLSVSQDPDLLKRRTVRGLPRRGKSLLLSEDDVVARVRHLLESGLVELTRRASEWPG